MNRRVFFVCADIAGNLEQDELNDIHGEGEAAPAIVTTDEAKQRLDE